MRSVQARLAAGSRPWVGRLLVIAVGLVGIAAPALANGGTVRISQAPVGAWFVTVYSSPTPLRTGEIDISVLVQDSADRRVEVPITVVAAPVALQADTIRREATRGQATNKLFSAAKFAVDAPGRWVIRVEVDTAGSVSFEADIARRTILDRPLLLTVLIGLPLTLVGWLLLGREPDPGERGAVG